VLLSITGLADTQLNISIENDGSVKVDPGVLSNWDYHGDPSYLLDVITSDAYLEKGDIFSINMLITGVGIAEMGKIGISVPPYIIEDGSFELSDIKYNFTKDSNNFNYSKYIYPINDIKNGFAVMRFSNLLFLPYDAPGLSSFGEWPRPNISKKGDMLYPLMIRFKISSDAPPGDHIIDLSLFYKFENKWYSDHRSVVVHVKRWYEENYIQYLVISNLLVALGIAIFGIGRYLWNKNYIFTVGFIMLLIGIIVFLYLDKSSACIIKF